MQKMLRKLQKSEKKRHFIQKIRLKAIKESMFRNKRVVPGTFTIIHDVGKKNPKLNIVRCTLVLKEEREKNRRFD